jgi:hypothetical protein
MILLRRKMGLHFIRTNDRCVSLDASANSYNGGCDNSYHIPWSGTK